MPLRRKIGIFYTVSILALTLVFMLLQSLLLVKLEKRSLELRLLSLAEMEEDLLEKLPEGRWLQELAKVNADIVQLFEVKDKAKLVFSKPPGFPPLEKALVARLADPKYPKETTTSEVKIEKETYKLALIRMLTSGKAIVLLLGYSLEPVESTLRHLLILILCLLPALGVVSYILSSLLVKASLSPVREIIEVAKSIGVEDLSRRIPVYKTGDEIQELAETFNYMIERLERSVSAIKRFSGEAAHQLKSPLTALQTYVELLMDECPQKREELGRLQLKLKELARLVDGLLHLSKLDSSSIQREEVSLDVVLLEIFEELKDQAEEKGLNFKIVKLEPAKLLADRTLIKHALFNIVENAVKFTKEGEIRISLTREKSGIIVEVEDTGPGVENVKNKEQWSFGLSLAERIIKAHNGNLEFEAASKGVGTKAVVVFK